MWECNEKCPGPNGDVFKLFFCMTNRQTHRTESNNQKTFNLQSYKKQGKAANDHFWEGVRIFDIFNWSPYKFDHLLKLLLLIFWRFWTFSVPHYILYQCEMTKKSSTLNCKIHPRPPELIWSDAPIVRTSSVPYTSHCYKNKRFSHLRLSQYMVHWVLTHLAVSMRMLLYKWIHPVASVSSQIINESWMQVCQFHWQPNMPKT